MADNVAITAGSGTTIAADDVGGALHQRVKVTWGADGTGNDTNATTPLPVQQTSGGFDVQTSVTRPANTTAYAANDVLGAAAAAISFASMGPASGSITITGAQLEVDISAVPSGMSSFKLAMYSVTPPSALADNAAFDLPSGDRASFLGFLDLGSPVDLGATLYVETAQSKQIKLGATPTIFAYLITNGAFTPANNSEVYAVTLHAVAN